LTTTTTTMMMMVMMMTCTLFRFFSVLQCGLITLWKWC